jgi:hypothetical protein
MNGAIHGLSERKVQDRLDAIVAFAELEEFIDMPVRTYSSGMSMRLAFAISSHVQPDVLLLDEVLAVGDEAFQRKCMGRIAEFRRGGGTLVFVSHDPAAVERVCDRAVLLEDGAIVADGSPETVIAAYHRMLADDGGDGRHADAGDADLRMWGNRAVRITEARLIGPDGPTDRFTGGERLTIEMEVEAPVPVPTPIFGVAISNVDGPLIFGTNTRLDAIDLPELHGSRTVRFTVPALPLHDGRFAVTLAVHSYDEDVIYHWLDRWLEFSVFPVGTGVGPVDLSGAWTLEGGPVGGRTR